MEDVLDKILKRLYENRGIDFSDYKPCCLKKRLSARMEMLRIKDPVQYFEYLCQDPSESDHLLNIFAVRVSSFFRNPVVFELIAQKVLPKIIAGKKNSGAGQIRVWSAGCASGEEAYSIAILIYEALIHENMDEWYPLIFGTDISEESLAMAEKGIYKRDALENTKIGIFDRYFSSDGNGRYRISPFIKNMVRFSQDDLASKERFAPADSVFGSFDLILCRNVLIYFSSKLQKRVIDKLYKALDDKGFLVIGDSESLFTLTEEKLTELDSRNRIFQK